MVNLNLPVPDLPMPSLPPTGWAPPAGAAVRSLASLPAGASAVIAAVVPPADAPHWAQQLVDIGCVPGERVSVRARGWPGGDPLAVCIGNSRFALRLAEAACVRLMPDPS